MSEEKTEPTKEQRLKERFSNDDLEWRVQRSGLKGDKPWAMILVYVTSRAIMDRLDLVMGPANWKDEYVHLPNGIECRLSLKIGKEWVTKVDGAPLTQVESFKGGYSDALKRAAVKWGVGRYLYNVPSTFATFVPKKTATSRKSEIPPKSKKYYNWEAPKI